MVCWSLCCCDGSSHNHHGLRFKLLTFWAYSSVAGHPRASYPQTDPGQHSLTFSVWMTAFIALRCVFSPPWRTRWPLFPSFFILPLMHLAKTEGDMSKWAVLSVCQSHLHKYLHLLLLFTPRPCRSPCSPLVFGEYPLSFKLPPILEIWEVLAFFYPSYSGMAYLHFNTFLNRFLMPL